MTYENYKVYSFNNRRSVSAIDLITPDTTKIIQKYPLCLKFREVNIDNAMLMSTVLYRIDDNWYSVGDNYKLVLIPEGKLKTFKIYFDDVELCFNENVVLNVVDLMTGLTAGVRFNTILKDCCRCSDLDRIVRKDFYDDNNILRNLPHIPKLTDLQALIINCVDSQIASRFTVKYGDDICLDSFISKTPKFISSIDTMEGDICYFRNFKISKKCLDKLLENKTLSECSFCNKYYFKKEMHGTFCEQCYRESMTHCEECGKEILKYTAHQGLCSNCYTRYSQYKVNNYSYNPQMKYYNDDGSTGSDPSAFSGIGIELEVDGGGENLKASKYIQELLNNEVYVKHDGSLQNGFEIITYPHTIKSFYKIDWKTALLDMIKHGYRSHDIKTCGLHMHVSRNMLTEDNLAKLIYFFETHKKDLTKFSRRDATELSKWACFYTDEDVCRNTNCYTGKTVTKKLCYDILSTYNLKNKHDLRYKALNLQKKPTVEFRLMRGTLNYKTFLATIDFLLGLIRNSKTVSWNNIDNTKLWLRGMNDNTKEYMKKRKCFDFNSEINQEESDL